MSVIYRVGVKSEIKHFQQHFPDSSDRKWLSVENTELKIIRSVDSIICMDEINLSLPSALYNQI